ncbi:MAG TPA: hypothetical protein VMA34_08120 [Terracidiphilus sp.]|nr:hypothetical protein [Terracidiphilus sp.]
MHPRLVLCLFIVTGIILGFAAWRLFVIYRRRKRWKMLTTSHQSLHVARERIVTIPPPPDED